jgi:hypothetical protein
MVHTVQWFLGLEAALFGSAALMHRGVLLQGYEHSSAAIAETVIALVLLAGLLATIIAPRSNRVIGLACQAFALLGTFVGLFTIAIGIGPRTPLDVALHSGMIALLVTGLVVVSRSRVANTPEAR